MAVDGLCESAPAVGEQYRRSMLIAGSRSMLHAPHVSEMMATGSSGGVGTYEALSIPIVSAYGAAQRED